MLALRTEMSSMILILLLLYPCYCVDLKILVKERSESDGDIWVRDSLCMFEERAFEGIIEIF